MELTQRLRNSIVRPLSLLLIIWLVFILDHVLGLQWASYGVLARDQSGIKGIFFMPLLHGSWGHLLSNTPPLFALMAMLWFFYPRIAAPAFLMIYVLAGLATWTFARAGVYHIGASGVIYGLVAFLFWNGLFRRNMKAIVISLIVLFYYGGLFMGILPGQQGISWDGHLLGALAGIFTAYIFRRYKEKEEIEEVPDYGPEEAPRPFLPPDTFDHSGPGRR
jgi:membrane associated rhomboid family serine protease